MITVLTDKLSGYNMKPLLLTQLIQLSITLGGMILLVGCMAFDSVEKLGEEIFTLQTQIRALQKDLNNQTKGHRLAAEHHQQNLKATASLGTQLDNQEQQITLLDGKISELEKITGIDNLTHGDAMAILNSSSVIEEIQSIQAEYLTLKESLAQSLSKIEAAITQLETQINTLNQSQPTPPGRQSAAKSPVRQPPLKTLAQARAAFSQRNYRKLNRDIPDLMAQMSRSSSKEELRYYLCEANYKLGELEDAVIACDHFLKSSPTKSTYISRAKLRLGDSYRHLGKLEVSRLYYDEVIKEFPSTADAKSAVARQK